MSRCEYQKATIIVLLLMLVGMAVAQAGDPRPMPPAPPPVTATIPRPPIKTVPVRFTPIAKSVMKWRVYLPVVCANE